LWGAFRTDTAGPPVVSAPFQTQVSQAPDAGEVRPRKGLESGDPPVTEGHGAAVTSLTGSFDENDN
jgi:hypothetical protein